MEHSLWVSLATNAVSFVAGAGFMAYFGPRWFRGWLRQHDREVIAHDHDDQG